MEDTNKHIFWKTDFFLNALAGVCVAIIIHETYTYLSFGGFMALFMLILLVPYFFLSVIMLLMLHAKIRRTRIAASILQIACPLPWLLFMRAVEQPISWLEIVMVIQAVFGIAGLVLSARK